MISLGLVGWLMISVYAFTCFIACVSVCRYEISNAHLPKCIGSLFVIFISVLLATRKCSLDVGIILNVTIPTLFLLALYMIGRVDSDRH